MEILSRSRLVTHDDSSCASRGNFRFAFFLKVDFLETPLISMRIPSRSRLRHILPPGEPRDVSLTSPFILKIDSDVSLNCFGNFVEQPRDDMFASHCVQHFNSSFDENPILQQIRDTYPFKMRRAM